MIHIYGDILYVQAANTLKPLDSVSYSVDSLHINWQVSCAMRLTAGIEVWALTWLLHNINIVVLRPFVHGSGWMLEHIVLLENKSSPQSQFSCTLDQLLHCCIRFTTAARCCHHRASRWRWCVCNDVQCLIYAVWWRTQQYLGNHLFSVTYF